MKKNFILGLLLFPCLISLAQQGIKLQVLTPPAPEVSALGKFGLVPVDNFTGVSSVTVPVYTIQDGALEFPVTLAYHAGGLKVKEDASEVGLGWALSAGGSVVSVTRGRPDFIGGFANSYHTIPDPPAVQMQTKQPAYSFQGWYYRWNQDFYNMGTDPGAEGFVMSGLTLSRNGVPTQYYNHFTVGYDGRAPDFASDLYMISIGDRSYKFIFNNSFQPMVLGDASLKIELIWNGTYPDWKVTDEKGIIYYFAQRQFCYSNNSYPPNSGTAAEMSAWHLSKIVSPTYGEINFKYISSATDFTNPIPNFSQTYLYGNVSAHTQPYIDKWEAYYTMYQRTNIDSIQFGSGYIKFLYDNNRLDFKNAWRLKGIEVRDKANKLVKRTVLDNNMYFQATDYTGFSGFVQSAFSEDNRAKRLKLNAVLEQDATDTTKFRKYSFTYNEQVKLPSKMSMAVDHWGYYNGISNTMLVPPTTLSLSTGHTNYFAGANRDANPVTMQANMLTGVRYPTGGTSNFTYETNQFQRMETVVTYTHEQSGMFKAAGSATVQASGFIDVNGNFTVGTNWVGKKLQIEQMISNPTYPGNYDMDLIVKKNNVFVARISIRPPTGYSVAIDSSIVLEAGNYNLSYEAATTFLNTFEIRRSVLVLNATITSEQVLKTIYAGGLRTSKITNVDSVSGNISTKTFTYNNGTADDLPLYESAEGFDAGGPLGQPPPNVFRYRYGQSIYPFSDGSSAPYFGYEKVEIKETDNAGKANGVSEYIYNTTGSININTLPRASGVGINYPGIINPLMATIPAIPAGLRGKLMTEKHYKLVDGVKIPVSSSRYYYTRENSDTAWQMVFNQGLGSFLPGGFNEEQYFRIYAHHFPVPILRNMLSRKEDSVYNVHRQPLLLKTERYTYDKQNGHYQLIKLSTQDSRGDTVNTYFKYPQDYGDLSAMTNPDAESQSVRILQQTHVVTPVEMWNEQYAPGATAKKYWGAKVNVFTSTLPVMKQLLTLETAIPLTSFTPSKITSGVFSKNSLYTSRIRYTKYDNSGHLLEQQLENNIFNSYIWDYNNRRPVAEVINAQEADIAYTSFEADGTGNWSGISSAYILNTGGITGTKYHSRTGFSLAKASLNTATSYFVSYWTLNTVAYSITGTQAGWPKKLATVVLNGKTWNQFEHLVTGQSTITVSGTGAIDELRLYPQQAKMTTFTYDPLVGITTQGDPNSRVSYYEYDGFNRLKLIKDQDGSILKTYDYHYKQ